jgi:hypothetical protein
MLSETLTHTARFAPPGLAVSDSESSTVSRERRRVALAAREVAAALMFEFTNRFEALEAKMDKLFSHLTASQSLLSDRVCRLEALYACTSPSVEEVLDETLKRAKKKVGQAERTTGSSKRSLFCQADASAQTELANILLRVANVPAFPFASQMDAPTGTWEPLEIVAQKVRENVADDRSEIKTNKDVVGKGLGEHDHDNEYEHKGENDNTSSQAETENADTVASKYGFSVGVTVGRVHCDGDIASGSHGIIDSISKDWAAVRFPLETIEMNPEALYRYGHKALGHYMGESVKWRQSDTKISSEDVGVVIGPRPWDKNQECVHVRFPGGVWCFEPEELTTSADISGT